jgi:hypothetical protein
MYTMELKDELVFVDTCNLSKAINGILITNVDYD